uniref:Uncharacterized protein n=1 Tax=Romanomermis culicivorax TaxID=13658 RepID=A0A915KP52_ROMCU
MEQKVFSKKTDNNKSENPKIFPTLGAGLRNKLNLIILIGTTEMLIAEFKTWSSGGTIYARKMSIVIESNSIDRLVRKISSLGVDICKPLFGFLIGYELSDVTYVVHLIRWSNKFSLTYSSDENEKDEAYLTKLSRRILRLRNDLSTFNFSRADISRQKRFLIVNRDNVSQKLTVNIIDSKLLAEDVKFCFPDNKRDGNLLNPKSQDFENQCHVALRPFFESLDTSVITFDGVLRDDFETCDASSTVLATILLPEKSFDDASEPLKEACKSKMQMKGNIVCRLQLPIKFAYGEAIMALKQDLIRSLRARIQLHAEGANVIEGEELAIEAFHRLPRRVFLSLTAVEGQRHPKTSKNNVKSSSRQTSLSSNSNKSILLVCDYLFESETVEDGAKNFAEVFDLDSEQNDLRILAEQICDDVELVPDECKLLQGDALDFSSREMAADRPYRTNSLSGGVSSSSMESVEQLLKIENRLHLNNYTFLYGLLALLVAFLSFLIYLMLNR